MTNPSSILLYMYMPARKKRTVKSHHSKLIHPKYHHHIHFSTLIGGIIIFLILILAMTKILDLKKSLAETGTRPTCLNVDSAVMNKNDINYATFDAQISVPYPEGANIECQVRYKYENDDQTQFGTITYSHPQDSEDQACIGEFPLAKPQKNVSSVEIEVVPFNTTKQIEGNTCTAKIKLP